MERLGSSSRAHLGELRPRVLSDRYRLPESEDEGGLNRLVDGGEPWWWPLFATSRGQPGSLLGPGRPPTRASSGGCRSIQPALLIAKTVTFPQMACLIRICARGRRTGWQALLSVCLRAQLEEVHFRGGWTIRNRSSVWSAFLRSHMLLMNSRATLGGQVRRAHRPKGAGQKTDPQRPQERAWRLAGPGITHGSHEPSHSVSSLPTR